MIDQNQTHPDPARERYARGMYHIPDEDGPWKAAQMVSLITDVIAPGEIKHYADVGCGNGGVFVNIAKLLNSKGSDLSSAVGYDLAPETESLNGKYPGLSFKRSSFVSDEVRFDLVTLNDVLEHLSSPVEFLRSVGDRARYVAIHFPLDDRIMVWLTNQHNYRLKDVGHLSFWNSASAINLATEAGLLPLRCLYTPGYRAPSGRRRTIQKVALPLRAILGALSPSLTARTVGGFSLALLCRGRLLDV